MIGLGHGTVFPTVLMGGSSKKKKKGGGSKKKNGERRNGGGGSGGKPSQGPQVKKHYVGRREVPPPPVPAMKEDDESAVSIDVSEGGTPKEPEAEQAENGTTGTPQSDADGDSLIDKEDGTARKASDANDKIETGADKTAATEEASDCKVEAMPSSNEEKGVDAPAAVEDEVDAAPESEPVDCNVASAIDNGDSDPENSSQTNGTMEPAHTSSPSDGVDAADPPGKAETVVVGNLDVDNHESSQGKKSSPTHANSAATSNDVTTEGPAAHATTETTRTSYSPTVSREEVDLDAPEMKEQTLPPLVRAFDGTSNDISPTSQDGLSFGLEDSTENEAFGFLTASLREALGKDADDISEGTLNSYIRWKPDVKRAAERIRVAKKFRKENSYIFDDKPLLLSHDPKMTLLLKTGMVLAPEELVAKDGSAVVILRAAKCDLFAHGCDEQDATRAILYVLQRMVVERNTLDPLKGVTIVLDLAGLLRKNVPSRKLAALLSKAGGCLPLRVRAIYVVAAPWWYPVGQRKLCSVKMRTRIQFLKDKTALFKFIERDRLLEEDGGIYNFDLQSWISSTMLAEVDQLL